MRRIKNSPISSFARTFILNAYTFEIKLLILHATKAFVYTHTLPPHGYSFRFLSLSALSRCLPLKLEEQGRVQSERGYCSLVCSACLCNMRSFGLAHERICCR